MMEEYLMEFDNRLEPGQPIKGIHLDIRMGRSVVRCRDCVDYVVFKKNNEPNYWCNIWQSYVKPDGFCYLGEKAE